MGSASSKSPLERRNTVLGRSQRRSLANLKLKIDGIYKKIGKLKETEPGPQYESIKSEIEKLKNELEKRSINLQPQVVDSHRVLTNKLSTSEEVLMRKLEDNLSKANEKKKKNKGKASNDDVEVQEISLNAAQDEITSLENTENKRHTVELKIFKVVPEQNDIVQADVHNEDIQIRTPEDKRKSILRQGGIPVMPGAMMNEIAHHSNRISKQYEQSVIPESSKYSLKNINDTIECLNEIELEISEFVGEKGGENYKRIRDALNMHLVNLNGMNPTDEGTVEQLKICKTYVGSCLNFLDERASEHNNGV